MDGNQHLVTENHENCLGSCLETSSSYRIKAIFIFLYIFMAKLGFPFLCTSDPKVEMKLTPFRGHLIVLIEEFRWKVVMQ